MSDEPILYKVKAQPARELTEEERAAGAQEEQPPHYIGIPLRDLTAADVDALPQWLQATLHADVSGLYEPTLAGKQRYTRQRNAAALATPAEEE